MLITPPLLDYQFIDTCHKKNIFIKCNMYETISHDVEIKSGNIITIKFQKNFITITRKGIALSNARVGEQIKYKMLESNFIYFGVVDEFGDVKIDE